MIYTKWLQYHEPFHLWTWGYGYADPKYMTIVAAIMNSIQRSIIQRRGIPNHCVCDLIIIFIIHAYNAYTIIYMYPKSPKWIPTPKTKDVVPSFKTYMVLKGKHTSNWVYLWDHLEDIFFLAGIFGSSNCWFYDAWHLPVISYRLSVILMTIYLAFTYHVLACLLSFYLSFYLPFPQHLPIIILPSIYL